MSRPWPLGGPAGWCNATLITSSGLWHIFFCSMLVIMACFCLCTWLVATHKSVPLVCSTNTLLSIYFLHVVVQISGHTDFLKWWPIFESSADVGPTGLHGCLLRTISIYVGSDFWRFSPLFNLDHTFHCRSNVCEQDTKICIHGLCIAQSFSDLSLCFFCPGDRSYHVNDTDLQVEFKSHQWFGATVRSHGSTILVR